MKIYRIFLLSFFTILLIPLESEAQRDVYNWQVTPYAGLVTIDNDISFPKNADTYAYGLRLERRLGNDFTWGLHFSQLDLGDADQANVSGGFLSLAYHWDNGYLLSQRSFLSVFHRLEIGYADRYSSFESINAKSADFAVGFENGLKFRLGDRISADLSLEIFSSKTNLTTGDITENTRYNVWKAGITYHFGSRQSNFVAPVFVPRTGIPSHLDKMEIKEDNIWIANDSVYKRKLMVESVDSKKVDPAIIQLTRADSMLIFMHFDSLYQRRMTKDTLVSYVDSILVATDSLLVVGDSIEVDTASLDSIPVQEYDSLSTSGDSLVSPVDSTQYFLIATDSVITPIDSSKYHLKTPKSIFSPIDSSQYFRSTTDSLVSPIGRTQYLQKSSDSLVSPIDDARYIDSGDVIILADSLKSDTVPVLKRAKIDSSAIVSPVVTDTVVILKADTVYMEKPDSEDFDQKSDTSAQRNIIDNRQARVDTLYIVKDGEEPRQKASEDTREVVKKSRATQSKSGQDAKIASLEAEIDRLKKKNKKNTGKVVAAGAAGAVLGGAVSNDKESEKDTVYVDNAEDTRRLAGLENELDSLKRMYGISDTLSVVNSGSKVDPPIGMYFSKGDTTTVFLPDTTYYMHSDSISLKSDTESPLKDDILREKNDKSTESLKTLDTTAAEPIAVADPDKSAAEAKVEAGEPKAEKPKTLELVGKYPVSCNFGLNKTSLNNEELEKLEVVLDDLKNGRGRKALLTGYTDKSGNADYNLQISKERANSVRDYLVSKGIEASRIEIDAGGVLGSVEKYSPDARRVEVVVVQGKK